MATGKNGIVYPSITSRIYKLRINLLPCHLCGCPHMLPKILAKYNKLKCSSSCSGLSKKFWALSAKKLGLISTPDGIRLDKDAHTTHIMAWEGNLTINAYQGKDTTADQSLTLLMSPSKKHNTTTFMFHVMSRLRPCIFTKASCLGHCRSLKVGFPGLACHHCHGDHVRSS
jgi:hypothetical protein